MPPRSIALMLGSFFCLVLAASPAVAENGSLLFDGTDDYVNVPEPLDLRGPLTLEAWVKMNADPSGGRIISNRNSSNGYELDVYEYAGAYRVRLIFNGNEAISADFAAYVGVWAHVAVAWGGPPAGTVSLYINGVLQGSFALGREINGTTGPLRIGSMGGGDFCCRGQIDEVRIWSAALDGATIAAWMSRPLVADHPNTTSLEGYWNFDEGSGQVVYNLAGDARRDGELGSSSGEDANDPQWQADGAPVPVAPATLGQVKQRYLKQ